MEKDKFQEFMADQFAKMFKEMQGLRTELKGDMQELRTELKGDILKVKPLPEPEFQRAFLKEIAVTI